MFRYKKATMAQMFGYGRVSTSDQDTGLQVDALTAAGVPAGNIVCETVSGAAAHKPKLAALLDRLQAGDTLVVWKVDRLGRSTVDALQTAERLNKAGVRVVITTLGVDMSTPAGRLVFGVLAQIAEFERELICERTSAGLAAAKARGATLGRRHSLTAHQRKEAARMVLAEGKSLGEVAAVLGCGRTIIHRAVNEAKAAQAGAA